MTQNPTPKRNREYQSRMHDCRNMERLQKALQILADAHDARTVPASLATLKTRDEIGALVRKSTTGAGGYYSVIEANDYANTTPAARELQAMIEGNPEQHAERERLRKIEALKAEIALSNIPGYFPTPAPIVATMLDRAQLEPGLTVLEPSAGSGNIADAVKAACPGAHIEVFECNRKLAELLQLKGLTFAGDDFTLSDTRLKFDRILMNPPFEKQADIDHVRHAFNHLKPGGVLVSVMAPGFEFRQDRKSTEFREWLNETGGTWEDLPGGAFKSSGTGISTRLVVITA
jgi:16S rRNA G1207 methylase RsmC